MKGEEKKSGAMNRLPGGLAGWLLGRLRKGLAPASGRPRARLALVDRITLAPRQSLALVEVEGRRFLIATSAEGAPAFCALNDAMKPSPRVARVSW